MAKLFFSLRGTKNPKKKKEKKNPKLKTQILKSKQNLFSKQNPKPKPIQVEFWQYHNST
ncbi:hypothetical protein HanXRQr2_Chr17g0791151 [Helianthus annuus]|uniref:Uncharacterized protein n=1 Tax=Helianthus annuus TaxID=4232 RepID=A0A9K3GU35_HELAN|nr:hypothetical protein HanXRQr2_Chr17g0791151 [Helianthus annuus]